MFELERVAKAKTADVPSAVYSRFRDYYSLKQPFSGAIYANIGLCEPLGFSELVSLNYQNTSPLCRV